MLLSNLRRKLDTTQPLGHSSSQDGGGRIRRIKVQKFVGGNKDSLIFFFKRGEKNQQKEGKNKTKQEKRSDSKDNNCSPLTDAQPISKQE